MTSTNIYDAVVIGSGPNGLAAAIKLAQAGLKVVIYEAKATIGGGMRSAEITLPGFTHDICSAIHPLAYCSPFFRTLPLEKHGLAWIFPSAALAHPFDDGEPALLERSIDATAKTLDNDALAYIQLMKPWVSRWNDLDSDLLAPLHFPKHPLLMVRFGLVALRSALGLSEAVFKGEKARGFFAGLAAHSILPLEKPITASFGLILGILGHVTGWPFPKGGSQKIADALASYFLSVGGEIRTNTEIEHLDQLPPSRLIFCDITPRQLLTIAGNRLPHGYRAQLEKYRHGPGVFKIDWALSHPIPWKAKACSLGGTVHLGGTASEIALSERQLWENKHPEKPYVLLAQQSLFDPTRAPPGKQTAWGYCHVPSGSSFDMTERIEDQIERFAPGFKDCILARSIMATADLERYNSNYIGGDISGGVQDIYQLFTRPTARLVPYSTPLKGLYLCSSSTPPGGGVHGMCGYHAALSALNLSGSG